MRAKREDECKAFVEVRDGRKCLKMKGVKAAAIVCVTFVSVKMRRLNCQGAPWENLQNWKCAGKFVSFDSQLQQCHQAESSSPLLQEKNVMLLLKSNLQSKVQTL